MNYLHNFRQRSFSTTLNPEQSLMPFPISSALINRSEKIKDRMTSSLTKESYNSRKKYLKSCLTSFSKEKTEGQEVKVDRDITINKLTKDRHYFQSQSEHKRNQWNFIYQKIMEEKKKKENNQRKAKQRQEQIKKNKSYRSFLSQEIKENNKSQIKKKLSFRRQVISQRNDRKRAQQLQSQQKQLMADYARCETIDLHRNIDDFKERQLSKNKRAVKRIKQVHRKQQQAKQKIKEEKKKQAEENFNTRWKDEFKKRRNAAKQATMRDKFIRKKLEKYSSLIKTLKVEGNLKQL